MSLCSLITETQTRGLDAMKRLILEVIVRGFAKLKLATCPNVHQSPEPKLGALMR
jgi:hypothetical protein